MDLSNEFQINFILNINFNKEKLNVSLIYLYYISINHNIFQTTSIFKSFKIGYDWFNCNINKYEDEFEFLSLVIKQ